MRQFYTQGYFCASYFRNLKFHKFFIKCTCVVQANYFSQSPLLHTQHQKYQKHIDWNLLQVLHQLTGNLPISRVKYFDTDTSPIYLLNYKLTFQQPVSFLSENLIVHL